MGAVVIAEDDPDIRAMITEKLSRAGHQVTAAEDGAAAIVAVKRSVPDVVVLDMQMPGLSGLDVVRLIRADPSTAKVPVIMVTSHSQPQYIGESFNSGADDFLAKPFSPRELAARIDSLMNGSPGVDDDQLIGAPAPGSVATPVPMAVPVPGAPPAERAVPAPPSERSVPAPVAETVAAALVATEEAEAKVGRRRFFRLLTSDN
ncbi:response regulator transcription factor [Cryptosporangium arvum]|uniref:response regulator transcription factor n=1 Tax=Cryptosporangium arvum TaxID=80871 RepID=UPI0004B50365|nr:response regulator transcription factor [Cryptosporangium arvum]